MGSRATATPEAARSTARRTGAAGSLPGAVVRRFLDADGTSHTRALAYETILISLSGFLGLIGLASVLGIEQVRVTVQHMAATMSPGPSGKLLEQAARQGATSGTAAAVFGLLAALGAGTLAMAQVERSANRLAGVADRPAARRFVRAFALAVSAGLLLATGATLLAGGAALASGFGWRDTAISVWSVARWPLGVLVVSAAIWLLFRSAPRREIRPPRALWTAIGVAVVLWVLFTGGLALYLSIGGGSTYGPLMAVVALLLWSLLTSLALHLGLSVGYELRSRAEPGTVRLPDSQTLPT